MQDSLDMKKTAFNLTYSQKKLEFLEFFLLFN